MDKLKMMSADKVQGNIQKIRELFPNAVTEVLRDGKPTFAVDFEVLKQELADTLIDERELRYQFTWPDKQKSVLLANTPISATLRPCKEESVDFDNTQNLYIEGDNLDVLKLLQETYLGKIKMIYIDPPYNTGNDFVYNDDFAQDNDEYAESSGQYDDYGNRLVQNTESNGRFHTDWLNMIYPRLRLAKDLLSEDGVILLSISDNELCNLIKLCNEIFGEINFIAQLNIITGANQSGEGVLIQKNVEYCLCYAKDILSTQIVRVDKTDMSYRNLNDAPTPLETRQDMGYTIYWNSETNEMIPRFDYDKTKIKTNDEKQVYFNDIDLISQGYYPVRPGKRNGKLHRWRWGIETFLERKNEIRMFQGKDGIVPKFLQSGYNAPKNIQNFTGGALDLKRIFGDQIPFDYPKGIGFIKYITSFATTNDSIVLDFFSGSATTAHAVMQLNAEDGGNRKFIMVQLPETCDKKSEAFKAGYKNICEIGKERIRRAGKKILELNDCLKKTRVIDTQEQLNILDVLKGNDNAIMDFIQTQPTADMSRNNLDIGFRVLKLDSSNMQDVYYKPEEYSQSLLSAFEDNIKADRTPLDLLFQVMLELGKPLSAKIEEKEIAGKEVFIVDDNDLIACFDNDITDEAVKTIAQLKPLYAVFRDSSLHSDSTAANFDQIFATYSPTTIRKVL
ncbi:MAG: site-specific DNA-methyltransferase [Roseburia sp.]|nr:site-specific DNA-methyltransferase [Roseburia sp.]